MDQPRVYLLFRAAQPVAITADSRIAVKWEMKGRMYAWKAYTIGEHDEKVLTEQEIEIYRRKGE